MDSAAGATPVPLSAAATMPPGLALMVRLAILSPVEVGLKVRAMVQLHPACRATPAQPLLLATPGKWFGSWPPSGVPMAPVAEPPLLVTVKVTLALAPPTPIGPKLW